MQIDKKKEYSKGVYIYKNFTVISEEEAKMILSWRNDSEIRKFMYTTEIISLDSHLKFVESLKTRDDCVYWLVFREGKPTGVVSLTDIKLDKSQCELGYYMSPEMGKTGIGLDFLFNALLHVFENIEVKELYGGVHRENVNAITLDKYLELSIDEKTSETFYPWILSSDYFLATCMEKNNIIKYVKYIKTLR